MKNEQLKQRMRQDVGIHIPYQPPTSDQKPYDIGGTSYLTLLPAPSNRTRYAAGAAACVAMLAGTAVAVHFLTIPGPGDVSSAPTHPSETTYSAVSTAPGETSGTETETTFPETDGTTVLDADSSAIATQATSQITAPTEPVKPDEPQPPITAANRISKVYGAIDDPYPYVIMENGDLYHWWNNSIEEEHLQRTPEGRKYAKADKEYANVQQYERIYVDAYTMEMLLTRDGKLSVKGYLPTKDGEYKTDIFKIDPFVKENGRQQETMTVVTTGVRQIQPGLYLTNSGDVYIYGFVSGKAYCSPVKLLDHVVSIHRNGSDIYALTDSGQVMTAEIKKGLSITWRVIGENARSIGGNDQQCYYLSNDGDLYTWGRYSELENRPEYTGSPMKVASQVEDVQVSSTGFAYLDKNRNLYIAGVNAENAISDRKQDYITEGILVAKNVKSYSYHFTLLYIDELDALHSFGANYNTLRGTGESKPAKRDTIILEHIDSFGCSGDWAMAVTESGDVYSWGANTIGLRYEDDEWFALFMIETPFKINPLT